MVFHGFWLVSMVFKGGFMVCLSVTKNHHFLLGVSCNHLNPHNHPVQLQVSFDGSRLVFHGSMLVFIGFQWFRLVLMVFHGSRSVFMVLGRF